EGKLTADVFMEAAANAEMFQGAAVAAGNTTQGAWSNTRAQLAKLGEEIVKPLFGENGPMVTLFKATRQALIDVRPWFKTAGESLGKFLVPRIERLGEWLTSGGIPDMV